MQIIGVKYPSSEEIYYYLAPSRINKGDIVQVYNKVNEETFVDVVETNVNKTFDYKLKAIKY